MSVQQKPAESVVFDSAGAGGRGTPRMLIVVALALTAMFVAALLVVRLGKGQVVVEGPAEGELPPDVTIVLSGGGKQLEIGAADKWKLSVQPETYVVDIRGGDDTFEIKEQEIRVKRFGKKIIKITRQGTNATADVKPPPATVASADLAGSWTIREAENLEGQAYGGTVHMKMLDSGIVELQWFDEQRNSVQTGIGLVADGHLLAAWSVSPSYGFCLYKTQPDGTMQARWTIAGASGRMSTETASGGVAGKLEGTYQIEGTPLVPGGRYQGTMSVMRLGEAYAVDWTTPEGGYRGIGLRHGDYLAIGWSLARAGGFGVVDYQLDGPVANGRWTMIGENRLSFENLQRNTAETPR